jgi:hypothetical protein
MSRKYSRRNYIEVVEKILPEIYKEKDLELASIQQDISHEVLNADTHIVTKFSHLNKALRPLIQNYSDYFGLGPWNTEDFTDQTAFQDVAEERGFAEGLIKYFVPQNNLTIIDPDEFVLEITSPLGYDLLDYSTSAEFHTFFKDTLFPQLTIAEGSYFTDTTPGIFLNVQENTNKVFGESFKDTVRYLINSLGLFQLINFKTDDDGVWESIRTAAADIFTRKIFLQKEPVTLVDAINLLKRVDFENQSSNLFEEVFKEGGNFEINSSETYLSGTQSLEKQYVWNSLLYGLDDQEVDDDFTKNFYIAYFIDKFVPEKEVEEGPFKRFLKAVGFLIGDIDNQVLSLTTLNSIEKCPAKFLPYLADTIGWKFYTNNPDSWRRQLREARSVLQKKGTKQGLIDVLKLVLPAANIDFDNGYREYYESYIPNLIFYMLKTESTLLQDENTWTQTLANEFTNGEFDPSDVNRSIRYVVDHILLEAVHKYPGLFKYKGKPFDVMNPMFRFNNRGRNFPIPPWEFEEFYDECDISEDLIEFFSEKLFCLGVDAAQVNLFKEYILDSTIYSSDDKHYNCGFTFLTNGIKVAPNYTNIINNFKEEYFDYLPMWNGKSSQFTLVVSSGTFEDSFDGVGAFTRDDFFNSLEVLRDFIPAKADERIDVQIKGAEYLITFDKIHPRLVYPFVDLPQMRAAMASYESKTIDMTDASLKLTGIAKYPNGEYDFTNSPTTNDHTNLTIFRRGVINYKRATDDPAWKNNKSPHTVVYNETQNSDNFVWKEDVVERNALRRRNFEKTLSKGNLFTRTGFNPPSFFNRVTVKEGYQGVDQEYFPLGLIPNTMRFETIEDHVNLPAVYEYCENAESNRIHNGFRTSNAFESRKGTYRTVDGFIVDKDNSTTSPIEARYRDSLDAIYDFIYSLVDKKLLLKTGKILSHNYHIFNNGSWKENEDSVKSALWNDYDLSFENDFTDVGFNTYKRIPNEDNKGLAYLYQNNYVANGRQNISNAVLDDLEYGGSSIVSHVYGPIFWNGLIQFNGKYGTNVRSINIGVEREFELFALPSIQKTATSDFAFHDNERSVITFLSGIEFVDKTSPGGTPASKPTLVTLYNLQDNGGFLPDNTSIYGNNVLTMKAFSNNPRMRWSFDYDPLGGNYLEPEDKFSLEISSLYMDETSFETDAKSSYIIIRTEVELDKNGDEVFWVFTKNNKWEMFYYTEFSSANSTTKLDKFYHRVDNVKKKLDVTYLKCYPEIEFKEPLYSVTDSDFHVNRIEFDTLNRKIDLPMSYYVPYGHVHRKNQKYVVEVIPQKDSDPSKYWVFRGLKCVDETKSKRAHIEFDETIPDYKITRNITTKDLDLLYSDSTSVPFGTLVRIDSSGYLYHGDERLTIAIKQWTGKPFLYKSISTDINYDLVTKIPYEGFLKFNNNTKKGLLSLLQTIKLETSNYVNAIEDPIILNPLSATEDSWTKPFAGRGRYPEDVYDYNDPSYEARPTVSLDTTVIPRTTPWGSFVTVVDCDNPSPIYGDRNIHRMDSYIRPYDYAKELKEVNYITVDPYDGDNETYYYTPRSNFTMRQLPLSTQPAEDPKERWNYIRDNQIAQLPELLWWDDPGPGPGNYNSPLDHAWNVSYVVIDRAVETTNSLPDVVTLSLNGTTGWHPHHEERQFFRTGRALTNVPSWVPFSTENLGSKAVFMGTTDEDAPLFPFTTGNGNFAQMVYFKNDDKNIQAGTFDVGNYTVIWMAVNVTRTIVRSKGAGGLINNLSGLDFDGNVVETPGLALRLGGMRNRLCLPTIGFHRHFDDFAPTELDDESRKCSVGIAHCATFRVIRDEDFIFTQDFFLDDSNLKATTVEGKDLGTFTTSSITIPYKMNPTELTGLFRFYNLMGDDLQSRDSEISSNRYGTNGGGRSSYREHPAAYLDTNNFEVDQRIDNLRIKN